MKKRIAIIFTLLICCTCILEGSAKRSGSRSRGSSRSTSTFSRSKPKADAAAPSLTAQQTRENKKPSYTVAKPAVQPQPSAPKEPVAVQKTAGKTNQNPPGYNSPGQPPPGYNAPSLQPPAYPGAQNTAQKPIGWNVGDTHNTQRHVNQQQNHPYPPSYSAGAPGQNGYAYPNNGANNYYGTGNNYNYGSHQGYPQGPQVPHQQGYAGVNQQQQGYGGMHAPGAYGGPPQGYQQGYGGMSPQQGYGGMSPQQGYGGMSPQQGYGGMPPQQGYGGYGGGYQQGYGGFQQPSKPGGFFSGLMGGGNKGYGGYGMMGGGYGMMGKSSSGGFFGKHAFRNVLAGLLVWNLVKAGIGYKYRVYNHYNYDRPIDMEPQQMELPPNLIMLCPEGTESLCLENTYPLCTTNNTVLCVTTIAKMVPCEEDANVNCANTSIPCNKEEDTSCNGQDTQQVTLPCVGNLSVTSDGKSEDTSLCVTVIALPDGLSDNITNTSTDNTLVSSTTVLDSSTIATSDVSTTQDESQTVQSQGGLTTYTQTSSISTTTADGSTTLS